MKKIVIITLILGLFSIAFAESLEDKLKKFGEENGKGYMQPFVNAMSANLNSGMYSTAKVLKPFRFGVFFNTMFAFVPDAESTFNAVLEGEEEESATVWGKKGATFDNGVKLPNGANLSAIPLMVPQVHLGLPAGNELMLRFFPKMEVSEKTGELMYLGVGLKHSLNKSIIKLLPIDFAVQATYQHFKLGDIVEMNSFSVNGQVSKRLLAWTLYGGVGYEGTELKAEYKQTAGSKGQDFPGDGKVKFSLQSDNDIRATVGIRYSVLLAKFYADYSICKYPVLNIGVGVSL